MDDIVSVVNMFDTALWHLNNNLSFDKANFRLGISVLNCLSSEWSFNEDSRVLRISHYGMRKEDFNILTVGSSNELIVMVTEKNEEETWIMLSAHKEKESL